MGNLQFTKSVEEYLHDFLNTFKEKDLLNSNPELLMTLSEALTCEKLPLRSAYEIATNDGLFTYLYECGIEIRSFMCALEMYIIKAGNLNAVAHCFFRSADPRSVYETIIPHIKNMLEVFYD